MAVPFEKRPTLREYLDWAHGEGCKTESGLCGMDDFVRITTPENKVVIVFDISLDDGLTPSMVSHLNRRTGLISPFSGRPEHP